MFSAFFVKNETNFPITVVVEFCGIVKDSLILILDTMILFTSKIQQTCLSSRYDLATCTAMSLFSKKSNPKIRCKSSISALMNS